MLSHVPGRSAYRIGFKWSRRRKFLAGPTGLEPATSGTAAAACAWMTIEQELHIPPDMTSLSIEIRLLDDTAGDGNDLALDVISLCRISG